jgi:DNA topoisomerase 2-associated protein PAT1
MSLAQVEAALAANSRSNQQQPQQEQVPFGYPQDAVQVMAWKQQQKLMEQLSMDREMKRRQDAQKVNKRGGKI